MTTIGKDIQVGKIYTYTPVVVLSPLHKMYFLVVSLTKYNNEEWLLNRILSSGHFDELFINTRDCYYWDALE
jgi:hypothetical protein